MVTITVPWAARWSGELSYDPLTVWDGEIHYPDFRENRDEHGYLWRREGARRTGEPQYSQLNAYRQKASMRAPKCQVCGTRLKPGPIRWLLPKKALSITPEGEVTVISPPTCEDCVELARKACPHLRAHGSDLLLVKRWHVWGVIGEVFVIENGEVVDRVKDVCLQYGRTYKHAGPHNFVVRQQVVALDEYEVLDEDGE
jgi:hypothetical protein